MVNIHNILLWLNAGMETPALMVNDILNNALLHSSPHISQSVQGVGMQPPKCEKFPLFGKESPHRGEPFDRFLEFLWAFILLFAP